MRKILIALTLCLFGYIESVAQCGLEPFLHLDIGIKAAPSLSSITGPSGVFRPIIGGNIGVSLSGRLVRYGFKTELEYSFQGAHYIPTNQKLDLQYIKATGMMRFYPLTWRPNDIGFYVGTGIGFNFLTWASIGSQKINSESQVLIPHINDFEVAIPIEVGIEVWRLGVALRYDWALTDVFRKSQWRGSNSSLLLNVTFRIPVTGPAVNLLFGG